MEGGVHTVTRSRGTVWDGESRPSHPSLPTFPPWSLQSKAGQGGSQ